MDVVRVVTPTDFAASRKRDARETIGRGDDAEGRTFEIDDEDVVDGFVSHASEDVDEIGIFVDDDERFAFGRAAVQVRLHGVAERLGIEDGVHEIGHAQNVHETASRFVDDAETRAAADVHRRERVQ